jgi:hypothetical protein
MKCQSSLTILPATMDLNEIKHIVTELVESRIRYDNERLIQMNMEFVRYVHELEDAQRRLRTLYRIATDQVRSLQDRITEHERWDGIHYAAIREYFVNDEQARLRWEEHFSFHDETFEQAIRDNLAYGIQYDGLQEIVATDIASDDEIDEDMLAEIDDIANNWL